MHEEEVLEEAEIDIELEEEKPEKTVCARLIFDNEQKSDLQQAFDLLDYNGEGKIRAEDFRVAIKALGYEPTKEELQKMISGVDKGQTGKLSFENFETAIMRKVMSLDSDGDIMKSFRLFDMNDTGFISVENVKRVTDILGTYLTDEEIDEMVDDADTDYDGYISAQEFMKMIKNSVNIPFSNVTESDNETLEEKTEHLMNVVVESRKRFGKMCIDYERKSSLMENKILNMQLETIANYRFKSKNLVSDINIDEMTNDIDTFSNELLEMQQRVDNLKRNIKNTQAVVFQLKADRIGKKLQIPLTADAMLANAKNKINL
ncbi:putative centrin [Danaus plexippus plexippus]|uniref:Centrin n=1 Tax=Danaus plexippus plexippus TaxID=278856 RepID=A0A212FBI6_DANPL|nr:putative centrin [Danaus plexippus plexippus]